MPRQRRRLRRDSLHDGDRERHRYAMHATRPPTLSSTALRRGLAPMSSTMDTRDEALTALEARIGVRFSDRELLRRALRHRSAGRPHNERLEFLGDAIIGLYVAERLYRTVPNAKEGDLTRLRALLVRRESLARLARELDLGRFVEMGGGMLKTGGRSQDSTLADTLEALVGAIHLDQGRDACQTWLDGIFSAPLAAAVSNPPRKDYRSRLQELLQARGDPLPVYRVIAEQGAPHQRTFTVECSLTPSGIVQTASAGSRRHAEQEAARLALEVIEDE